MRLNIPLILQKYLLEEGERICNKGPIRTLPPVRPTVAEVLNEFLVVKGSSPLENHLLSDMIQVTFQLVPLSARVAQAKFLAHVACPTAASMSS